MGSRGFGVCNSTINNTHSVINKIERHSNTSNKQSVMHNISSTEKATLDNGHVVFFQQDKRQMLL